MVGDFMKRAFALFSSLLLACVVLVGCDSIGTGTYTPTTGGGGWSGNVDDASTDYTGDALYGTVPDVPGGTTPSDEEVTYGEPPTADTGAVVDDETIDISAFSGLPVPDGAEELSDEIYEALARALMDMDVPSDVYPTQSDIDNGDVFEIKYNITNIDSNTKRFTWDWQYKFGKGDALLLADMRLHVIQKDGVISDYEVTAVPTDLRGESQNNDDMSNITDEEHVVDRVYPGISLSNGSVKVVPVSENVYGISIQFYASRESGDTDRAIDIDVAGGTSELPTLTVNGVVLVPELLMDAGGIGQGIYVYHGDIECPDDKVSVEWCGETCGLDGTIGVNLDGTTFGVEFEKIVSGQSTADRTAASKEVVDSIANSISGGIGMCHVAAGNENLLVTDGPGLGEDIVDDGPDLGGPGI